MDTDKAFYFLNEIRKKFEMANIHYWLDCGTLLGAVREGKFIPWDEGIDIGALSRDYHSVIHVCKNLPKEFKVSIFTINPNISIENDLIKKCQQTVYIAYKGMKIHIQFYDIDNYTASNLLGGKPKNIIGYSLDFILHLLILKEPEKKLSNLQTLNSIMATMLRLIPDNIKNKIAVLIFVLDKKFRSGYYCFKTKKKFFETLSNTNLYNVNFPAPSSVEEYLELRYGKDWRIPKRDFAYTDGD